MIYIFNEELKLILSSKTPFFRAEFQYLYNIDIEIPEKIKRERFYLGWYMWSNNYFKCN